MDFAVLLGTEVWFASAAGRGAHELIVVWLLCPSVPGDAVGVWG